MILEGNQRAGATKMALHLMNEEENDHVEIHEISGFLSDDVYEAFHEMEASARGTKCDQFMFSVSLNPPYNVYDNVVKSTINAVIQSSVPDM